jgi:molybdopterin-synthase adenylyltransferase
MNRYSRQILYTNIGESGQNQLSKKIVCIVGIGALGTVVSELLTRSGIGKIILIDRDFIELSNLQRQSLFDELDTGKLKSDVAKQKLQKINSKIKIISKSEDLDHINVTKLIGKVDLIIGCTDNMESRFLLNDYSIKNNIPYVYGGAVSDKGFVFNIMKKGPCLRCVFKGKTNETCDTVGILNSNSHIISSLIANESIKILLNKNPEKKLIHIDVWKNDFFKINVKIDKKCPVHNHNFEYLEGNLIINESKLCGKGSYQFKIKYDFEKTIKILNKIDKVKKFGKVAHFKNITLFADNRILVKTKDEKSAKKLIEKYIGN